MLTSELNSLREDVIAYLQPEGRSSVDALEAKAIEVRAADETQAEVVGFAVRNVVERLERQKVVTVEDGIVSLVGWKPPAAVAEAAGSTEDDEVGGDGSAEP